MSKQENKRMCEWCGKSLKSAAKLEKHLAAHEQKEESRFVWSDDEVSLRRDDR